MGVLLKMVNLKVYFLLLRVSCDPEVLIKEVVMNVDLIIFSCQPLQMFVSK